MPRETLAALRLTTKNRLSRAEAGLPAASISAFSQVWSVRLRCPVLSASAVGCTRRIAGACRASGRHFREWRAPRAGRSRSRPRSIGAFLRPAAEGIRRWRFLRHGPHSCTRRIPPCNASRTTSADALRTGQRSRTDQACGKADMPAAGRPASARDRRFFVVSRRASNVSLGTLFKNRYRRVKISTF